MRSTFKITNGADRPYQENNDEPSFDRSPARGLQRAFDGQFRPGVVTDTFGAGKALKQKYGFSHFPALVFVRDGDYVGAICRIQDWTEYLDKISTLLVAAPSRPPGFSIPVVTA